MSKKLHELAEKIVAEGNEYLLIDDSNGEGDSKKLPVSAITKPLLDKYNAVAEALEEVIDKYDITAEALTELILANATVYRYKGSVSTLPTDTTMLSTGDTYSISSSRLTVHNGTLELVCDSVPSPDSSTTYKVSISNEKIPGREGSNYKRKTVNVYYFDANNDILDSQTVDEECVEYYVQNTYVFTLNTEDLPENTYSIHFLIDYILELKKGDNVAWTGEYWNKFSATIDTSEFLKAEDLGDVQNSIDTLEADTDANTLLLERLKYYGDANIVPNDESEFTTVSGAGISVYFLNYTGSKEKVVVPYRYSDKEAALYDIAFVNNTTVKTIVLPCTMRMGENSSSAFTNCTNLESVVLPTTMARVTKWLFSGCTSLRDLVIPDSVTLIESDAFYNCTSLRDLVIPDSVTSIGSDAFTGCDNLIIVCNKGSYAEVYAKENGIPYKHYIHDNGIVETTQSTTTNSTEYDSNGNTIYSDSTIYSITLKDNQEIRLQELPTNTVHIRVEGIGSTGIIELISEETTIYQGFSAKVPETINDSYESYLSFVGGDTAPTITWESDIIFKGDDCDEDGIFTPVANTNYEIAFKYMGTSDESGIPTIIARVGSW